MPTFASLRFASVLLTTSWCTCASAASFECARARSPMEMAICATPELSALDEQLARSFRRARGVLSPEGAAILKTSQLSWLHYVERACARPPSSAARARSSKGEADSDCLTREMRARIDDLDEAGLKLGPYVLARADKYEVLPGDPADDTGVYGGRVVHHAGYPMLEGGADAATRWNAEQFEKAVSQTSPAGSEADADTDLDTDYKIGCANDHLLSVAWASSQYGHGGAHGLYSEEARTTLLAPTIHALTAADLFSPASSWQSRLPDMFWRAYLGKPDAEKGNAEIEAAIREAAAEDGRWLITPAGLRIAFSAYEAGSYMSDPGPITVSWMELKPLLSTAVDVQCRFVSREFAGR